MKIFLFIALLFIFTNSASAQSYKYKSEMLLQDFDYSEPFQAPASSVIVDDILLSPKSNNRLKILSPALGVNKTLKWDRRTQNWAGIQKSTVSFDDGEVCDLVFLLVVQVTKTNKLVFGYKDEYYNCSDGSFSKSYYIGRLKKRR